MKRSTKIVVASIIGVGLVGAVTAKQFSSHCDGGHGHGFSHHGDSSERASWVSKRVSKDLNLSETQQVELNELVSQMIDGVGEMRAQRPQLADLQGLLDTQFDQEKALAMIEQRTQSVEDKAPVLIQSFASFYDGLDSTQQAKVSEMIEKKMSRFGKRRGHHDERGSEDEH